MYPRQRHITKLDSTEIFHKRLTIDFEPCIMQGNAKNARCVICGVHSRKRYIWNDSPNFCEPQYLCRECEQIQLLVVGPRLGKILMRGYSRNWSVYPNKRMPI